MILHVLTAGGMQPHRDFLLRRAIPDRVTTLAPPDVAHRYAHLLGSDTVVADRDRWDRVVLDPDVEVVVVEKYPFGHGGRYTASDVERSFLAALRSRDRVVIVRRITTPFLEPFVDRVGDELLKHAIVVDGEGAWSAGAIVWRGDRDKATVAVPADVDAGFDPDAEDFADWLLYGAERPFVARCCASGVAAELAWHHVSADVVSLTSEHEARRRVERPVSNALGALRRTLDMLT